MEFEFIFIVDGSIQLSGQYLVIESADPDRGLVNVFEVKKFLGKLRKVKKN